MKRFYKFGLLTLIVFALNLGLNAQSQNGKTPESFKHNLTQEDLDHIQINPPSMDLIMSEDLIDEKNGQMMKIARLLPVDLTVENSGTWIDLDNGKSIWQLRLSSEGATACAIHFESFALPQGSELFVYSTDKSEVLGPYTSEDNQDGAQYAIGLLSGNDVILEYIAPKQKSITGEISIVYPDIHIFAFSYVYRGSELFGLKEKDTGFGASDACQVNANCPEGDNWRTQQKGIARIYAVDGMTAGYCSGTLINTTRGDQTTYFLTADHCGGEASTISLNQWIFRFNYESAGCTTGSEPTYNSVTGCSRKARGALNGGSDFLLLQLNTTATNIKNIGGVYNGWSRSTSASPSGVSIHHPSGDIKKISTYTSTLASSTYNGGTGNVGATNAHWRVYWAQTATNHGVTEGGSSGSPIFNNNGLVVGTLSGGLSYCDATNQPDLYGKMSYHWTSNGSDPSEQLEYWLDPDGTGATTCDYLDPNAIGLIAEFSGSPTTVAAGSQVSFTDMSTGGTITSRSWSFPGGSPSSSTATNPTITYNTTGTYNVSLTVNTGTETDTETKTGYITVTNGGGFSYDFEACTDFAVDQFAPCTTHDGDGSNTYGVDGVDFNNEGYTGSFMAFNSSTTTPASSADWQAHGGSKQGACFAATSAANNDWFITPQVILQNNSSLSFWAKSITDEYGLERFKVLISTTNNSTGSFSPISSGSFIEAPLSWTKYEYNLSAYDGQNVYIAIQCISDDAFAFMIDDITVETQASVKDNIANAIHIYPNPSDGIFTVNLPETGAKITIRNLLGQEVKTVVSSSTNTKIDLSNQNSGVYFIEIQLKEGRFTKKITIE
jgi:PKD repeat protein